MSGTIPVPAGLDALDAADQRLLDSMRDDGGGTAPAPTEHEAPASVAAEIEIDPDDGVHVDDGAVVDPADPAKIKFVPHAQFHAANERRKAAEAKAAAAELKLATETAKVNARLEMLSAALSAPAQQASTAVPEVEIPDVNIDPVGHFKAQLEQVTRRAADQEAILRGMQERGQQERQFAELRNWGAEQERAFLAKEPAYQDAMKFLESGRNAELEKIGVTDPAERRRILGNDIQQIAIRARQEGADFAERLYGLAEARGFKKAAPVAADPGAVTVGGVVVPPLEPAGTPSAAAVARAVAGRENSTTIGSMGAAPGVRLSAARIADMPEAQFAALKDRMNPAELRALLGE